MPKEKEPTFSYDEDLGSTICTFNGAYGQAVCNPVDYDFKNKLTGEDLAFRRMQIDMMRHARDNEIKPRLQAFRHLYACASQAKWFNEKDPFIKLLKRQIALEEDCLKMCRTGIKEQYRQIGKIIHEKDELYKKLRKGKIDKNVN